MAGENSVDGVKAGAPVLAGRAPEGLDALALGRMARELCDADPEKPASILHIARDDQRLAAMEAALSFFAPSVRVVSFPAWDCVPYDRVSPNGEIVARPTIPVSVGVDHRLVDGDAMTAFQEELLAVLRDPVLLLLDG